MSYRIINMFLTFNKKKSCVSLFLYVFWLRTAFSNFLKHRKKALLSFPFLIHLSMHKLLKNKKINKKVTLNKNTKYFKLLAHNKITHSMWLYKVKQFKIFPSVTKLNIWATALNNWFIASIFYRIEHITFYLISRDVFIFSKICIYATFTFIANKHT